MFNLNAPGGEFVIESLVIPREYSSSLLLVWNDTVAMEFLDALIPRITQ